MLYLNLITTLFLICFFVSGFPTGQKTPSSIESIFIARCLEYQEVVRPELFQSDKKNCTMLWRLFLSAFAFKDPCNVKPEAYDSFIKAASHYMDTQNRVMYWSGDVYPFVIEYSKNTNRYTTIRDQLSVYVLDSIEHWCGQSTSPGVNYNFCPEWGAKDCNYLATTSFWKQMSQEFAQRIRGMVHVMLNSSSPQPYRRSAIFAQSELARLKKEVTPEIHVHLVGLLDEPPVETCTGETVLQLKEDVVKKGMTFLCSEREPSVLYFQCVKNSNAKRCKNLGSTGSSSITSLATLVGLLMAAIGLTQMLI